ncbi:MAG TPA: SAM-dependent methyltransferase, partial [Rudaea sp.]|nr:SAM-dependent methyltransferase [Rudaea sp.]
MNTESTALDAASVPAVYGWLDRTLRARLLRQMSALRDCRLRIVDALGDITLGTPADDPAQ